MKLYELLENLSDYKVYGKKDLAVNSITEDSRQVKKGSLFVAVKGLTVDGHKFIPQAIEHGAKVIVGELDKGKIRIPKGVTYVKVENSRKALGFIASSFYGNPSSKLKVIGVTGTDGKTTTSTLIYYLLETAGRKAGLVSSVSAMVGNKEIDTGFHVTNPDPVSLHGFLAEMAKKNCEFAVVEVTSHGIDQERVSGVSFDSAVLTNITHEHLDYHKTFESYRDAKAKLFQSANNFVVLNRDDESFGYINSIIPNNIKRMSYGIKDRSVDLYGQNIHEENDKTVFEIINGVNSFTMQSKLPGEYNVANTLAAIATTLMYGVSVDLVKKALLSFKAPKGRLEKIENKKGIEIYIDFAHTPNSLENVLKLLRKRLEQKDSEGKLIAVFGCASERDVKKRPMMGEISTRIADFSIFTAEDPRSEKVEKIINQMVKGAKKSQAKEISIKRYHDSNHGNNKHLYVRIQERGEAISFAIQKLAKKGDIVVVCGKGHEKSMAYNGVEYEWSDQEAVEVALKGKVKEIIRSGL